jgi:hypothetical protein
LSIAMTGRRLQRHCSRSALRAVQPKFRDQLARTVHREGGHRGDRRHITPPNRHLAVIRALYCHFIECDEAKQRKADAARGTIAANTVARLGMAASTRTAPDRPGRPIASIRDRALFGSSLGFDPHVIRSVGAFVLSGSEFRTRHRAARCGRSTDRGRTHSRIVATLADGIVTTPRAEADLVVTEHGIAELRGRTLAERARALVAVADPAFRAELEQASQRLV